MVTESGSRLQNSPSHIKFTTVDKLNSVQSTFFTFSHLFYIFWLLCIVEYKELWVNSVFNLNILHK